MALQAALHRLPEPRHALGRAVHLVARLAVLTRQRRQRAHVVLRHGERGSDALRDDHTVVPLECLKGPCGLALAVVPHESGERDPAGHAVETLADPHRGSAGLDDILQHHDVAGVAVEPNGLVTAAADVAAAARSRVLAARLEQSLHQPSSVAGVDDQHVAVELHLLLHHLPHDASARGGIDESSVHAECTHDDGMRRLRQHHIIHDLERCTDWTVRVHFQLHRNTLPLFCIRYCVWRFSVYVRVC